MIGERAIIWEKYNWIKSPRMTRKNPSVFTLAKILPLLILLLDGRCLFGQMIPLLGNITCLGVWSEKLLVGTFGPGVLKMISFEGEQRFSITDLCSLQTSQILSFGQTLVAKGFPTWPFLFSFAICDLKRGVLWGSIRMQG